VQRAKQIELYCETKAIKEFGVKEWTDLCNKIGINASGLNNTEIQILRALKDRGDCSLNMLSAITGMSRSSLQRDAEIFLLQKGYMKIEGSRKLTAAGSKVLENLQKKA
jgi:Holliday junction resolvasome RuvABC ATP-dependent DNA helicase subunit